MVGHGLRSRNSQSVHSQITNTAANPPVQRSILGFGTGGNQPIIASKADENTVGTIVSIALISRFIMASPICTASSINRAQDTLQFHSYNPKKLSFCRMLYIFRTTISIAVSFSRLIFLFFFKCLFYSANVIFLNLGFDCFFAVVSPNPCFSGSCTPTASHHQTRYCCTGPTMPT